MAKKSETKGTVPMEMDPMECPFREFRDTELSPEFWGMSSGALKAALYAHSKILTPKSAAETVWVDDQTQPLPRSIRHYLHGWIRAEDLAQDRWDAEVVIFEENNGGKMSVLDIQLSHTQVLLRSSFCRHVLSACYMLERVENFYVEHQWENFICVIGPEGWRARYHIYSPGLKPGGGQQHRPLLSKNGCYLVRLFYLGAWRCVWVSDAVPVDATDAPLLPFSPLLSQAPAKPGVKNAPATVTSQTVHLWPLLLCKALLKIAAPDMNSDEDCDGGTEDEDLLDFDLIHTLTGCLNMTFHMKDLKDHEEMWNLIVSEVPVFSWDDDDETLASTVKSKSTKKPTNKESSVKRGSLLSMVLGDSKHLQPYTLPGITPGHEMSLLVTMARDLPLKKPLPEPEVPLWKTYRWVDWARHHGLYDEFECPRNRFLKVSGLMKLSYAPHLHDVASADSITFVFRDEQERGIVKKQPKDAKSVTTETSNNQMREELREWVLFFPMYELCKRINVINFPSMFSFTSTARSPPVRLTKIPLNRAFDMAAPKTAPLYLQIDAPDEMFLKISLSMVHPRVLLNCGLPIVEYVEPAYLVLERFEWFKDCELPIAKAFVQTRSYDTVEITFEPGRHFCRLWISSKMNWHAALLSEATLLLGTRDLIQAAAVRECPWAARYLNNLSQAFMNWFRVTRSNTHIGTMERDFYNSYLPDLTWDPEVTGYDRPLLHWMFRRALQSVLQKKLQPNDYRSVCVVLRRYLLDPDFGLPDKPTPPRSLREVVTQDPCDCVVPEAEQMEAQEEEQLEETASNEEKELVSKSMMHQLLLPPEEPTTSQVCDLATEEVPCGILKQEREKIVRKHEAATFLQANWRGTWARKVLQSHLLVTSDVLKLLLDNVFGNIESLTTLMNEFFEMFPGTRYAYSIGSALSGIYGLQQHTGTSTVTSKCRWVPYFQGVFYCHAPVKVHFDLQSTLMHYTFAVYNNDTGEQLPQVFNAHITFDFDVNELGYTVMGHGTIPQTAHVYSDLHWQLTVLSSIEDVFHVCDNDYEGCKELLLSPASKLHIDEIFLPNRRNILGGINITVLKHEVTSFRAAATDEELEMVAILRTNNNVEVARCSGKGELYWPYIRLVPAPLPSVPSPRKFFSTSHANMTTHDSAIGTQKLPKGSKAVKPSSAKSRSATKLRENKPAAPELQQYWIDVIAPNGWPLTLAQWKRVDEVRNSQEVAKPEPPVKGKGAKEKPTSAKDKDSKGAPVVPQLEPQPGDALVELECSITVGGGVVARRDDQRDLEFILAKKSWDAREPGRNLRGAQIRNQFREEFLVVPPPPPVSPSDVTTVSHTGLYEGEFEGEGIKKISIQQGPSPVSESDMVEMSVESEEESRYLQFPEQLKDKFVPLHFVPLCMKEKTEDSVLVTPDIIEAAKMELHERIERAISRMIDLQVYNEVHMLERQKKRCKLLEKLFVDGQWNSDITEVLEERDEAIQQEALCRSLSQTKKKQEAKKK